jgi:transposase-like protein
MEEKQIAITGMFCWNESCEEYQKINCDNIKKYGKTDKGVQRYRCKTCKKTFGETKGTMFYRCRHSEEDIVECMEIIGDHNSLAVIHRIKGTKEENVCWWIDQAATQIEQVEEQIVRPKKLSRVQMDALWTYVGHKGEKGGNQKKKEKECFGEEPQ